MNNPEIPKHSGQHLESLPEGVAIKIDNPEQMKGDEKVLAFMDDLSLQDGKSRKYNSREYLFPKNDLENDPNSAQA